MRFAPIMEWVESETGTRYGESDDATKAHRVLADHGRAMTFLASDGVAPSNEGRGYVMRRIVRRAVQHGARIGLEAPFLSRLADVVVDLMGDSYPELAENRADVRAVLGAEEERFAQTLATGMRLFDEVLEHSPDGIAGEDAFRLHDTYGFPLELTRELALEHGLPVDEDEFERLMTGQRERSRAGQGGELEQAAAFARDAGFVTDFVGFEKTDVLTQVGALEELGDGTFLAKLRESPFYPEGGGQVSDQGTLEGEGGARRRARSRLALRRRPGARLQGKRLRRRRPRPCVGSVERAFPDGGKPHGDAFVARGAPPRARRSRQAGGLRRSAREAPLRLLARPAATAAERERVEGLVNEHVFDSRAVRTFLTPIDEARALGATMLFGEKYGDVVRVVEVEGVSRELCGGTHVRSTAEIGAFKILSESSVGSATRRIEAVTSGAAASYLFEREREALRLREELEAERKAWSRLERQLRSGAGQADDAVVRLLEQAMETGGVRVVTGDVGEMDADALLDLSDRVKQKAAPAAVVLGARTDGRVHLVANFSDTVVDRGLNASDVVRAAAALVEGSGGGRPSMARAGGKNPERLGEAIAAAEQALVAALSEAI